MPDQPPPKPYGRLKLYALSASGLHRTTGDGSGWQLVREFDPISHARVLTAAERMPDERTAYVLWLLDPTLRNERPALRAVDVGADHRIRGHAHRRHVQPPGPPPLASQSCCTLP